MTRYALGVFIGDSWEGEHIVGRCHVRFIIILHLQQRIFTTHHPRCLLEHILLTYAWLTYVYSI